MDYYLNFLYYSFNVLTKETYIFFFILHNNFGVSRCLYFVLLKSWMYIPSYPPQNIYFLLMRWKFCRRKDISNKSWFNFFLSRDYGTAHMCCICCTRKIVFFFFLFGFSFIKYYKSNRTRVTHRKDIFDFYLIYFV